MKFKLFVSCAFIAMLPTHLLWTPLEEAAATSSILKVGVIKHPLVYFEKSKKFRRGFEYELLRQFAAENQLKLQIKIYTDRAQLIQAIRNQEIDLAMGRFFNLPFKVIPGPIIDQTSWALFCHRKYLQYIPLNLHAETSELLNKSAFTELQEVHRLQKNCAWVEEWEGAYEERYFKNVQKVLSSPENKQSVFWLLSEEKQDISYPIQLWLQKAGRQQHISRIRDHYQSITYTLTAIDIQNFRKNINNKLSKYKKKFKASANKYKLPWEFIAAIAYQESKWDSQAISPTGVLGMMQLTQQTAVHVNVQDRLDAAQSIEGGALYLSQLFRQINKKFLMEVPIESRKGLRKELWSLTLAAYNIGILNIYEAQFKAIELGLNPWMWIHIKKVLAEAENPIQYSFHIKSNTNKNQETIIFVERVKSYYDALTLLNGH